ncbi:glycoside hydrolase family 88/105 protein [Thalassotalea agariperforans]
MNKLLLSLSASCLIFAGGCTEKTMDVTQPPTYIDDPKNIISSMNAVADWQLQHMDDFESYIPSFIHRTEEKRGWVQGAFFLGLARWAEITENPVYFNYLREHGAKQDWKLGDRRYHADDHVIAQYYLHIHELDQDAAIIKPLITELDAILETPPTSSLDFIPKGKILAEGYDHDCQKRWCWSDALFMSPPVWFHLSKVTGDDKYAEYADREYKAVTDYLLDTEFNLYFRDSRFLERRETNGAKIFWSRGNGWVYSGLTQIIDFLPNDDPRRDWYIDLFQKMSVSLKKLQLDTGFWPVSLAAGELYTVPESSGTAFFVSGLAWGIRKGILQDDYLATVKLGWQSLLAVQRADGMLGYVQQVGYAPDKVSPNETQLYGTGAFLLAGTEVLKLVQKYNMK